jgi:hypothetical protein
MSSKLGVEIGNGWEPTGMRGPAPFEFSVRRNHREEKAEVDWRITAVLENNPISLLTVKFRELRISCLVGMGEDMREIMVNIKPGDVGCELAGISYRNKTEGGEWVVTPEFQPDPENHLPETDGIDPGRLSEWLKLPVQQLFDNLVPETVDFGGVNNTPEMLKRMFPNLVKSI